MSLRVKALLSSIIALLGLVAVSYVALQMILPSSFAQLEEQETRKDIARALDALAVNLAQLESATGDWARWDDTYDFIENANTNYIKANLTDSAFTNLRLDVMVFVHSSGRIVFSKGYDLQNRKEMPVPPSLQTYLTRGSYLTSHPDITSVKTGIVSLPEGPLLVASLPILTSGDQGPMRGTLIFGRFLDTPEIARLAQVTHLALALHRLDDPQMPADYQTVRAALSEQTPVIVRPLSEQTIVGYVLVKDIYGKPAFILSTEAAREIYRQGQVSATYLMWALVVIGVAFAGIAFIVAERLFLTRITGLSQDVQQIGARGDPARRVSAHSGDEISSLAREINQMLDAIQASEQRYCALFEGAPMIIYALDTAGRFTALNPAFEQVTGWARSEWLGRSFAEIIPPQDWPEMRQVFQQALRGELPKYAERHILSRTGATLTVELLGLPQRVNGQVVGMTGFALDITERKRAEEALRESEEKYRTLVERANDGIVILQDGIVQYANPRLLESWGGALEEVIGTPFVDHIPASDLSALFERYQRRMAGEDIAPIYETTLQREDGTPVPVELNAVLITYQGKPAVLVLVHDFTERKRAEEKLRESEERYRDLVEHSHALICTHDLQGRFLSGNQWALQLLGYENAAISQMNLRDLLAPEVRDQAEEYLARIQRDGNTHGVMLVQTRTGEKRLWEYHNTLRTEGVAEPIVRGIAHDITDQKRLEHALRESEERWRTYIEQANDLIFALDASGVVTLANRALCSTLGYTAEELVGTSPLDFIAPEARAAAMAVLTRVFSGEDVDHFEVEAITRDQRRIALEVRGRTFRKDGQIAGTFHVARDISERKRAEEMLRAERNLLRTMIDAIPDAIFVKDTEDKFLVNNIYHLRTLGVATQADTLGKTIRDFHPLDLAEQYLADDQQILQSGQPLIEKEQPYFDHFGDERRWHLMSKIPLRDAQGKIIGIVGVGRDITERKRAEEALRASEENYRRLFENATIGIFHSLPEGRFLRVNPALARMLGYASPEEMVALVTDISTQIYVDSRRRGDLLTTTLEQSDWAYAENRYRRKDGGIITANLAVRKVLDAKGAVAYLEGLVEDITARKRAEDELAQSHSLLKAAFDSTADGLLVVDGEGKITQSNRKFAEMWRIPPGILATGEDDKALAFVLEQLNEPNDFVRKVRELYAQPDAESFDVLRFKDGRVFERYSQPQHLGKQIVGRVWSFRDVTARQYAQAALKEYSERLEQMVEERTRELRDAQEQLVRQERLAVLGQLAGGIAHELRSPLSAIKNAAYYFKMVVENPSPDAREMIDILDQQIDVSARIIGSLLDFARPKTPTLQPAQLARVIEAAICQCTIPQNIAVGWQADESSPSIKVDAEQMQLVFSNLITNAAQAMPQGGQLTIAIQPAGDMVRVSFSDTGVGIPAEALDKVFQPLYTTKAKGIGLGLALCRIIVEAHAGTIAVTSEVGQGTTFSVSLPLANEGDVA